MAWESFPDSTVSIVKPLYSHRARVEDTLFHYSFVNHLSTSILTVPESRNLMVHSSGTLLYRYRADQLLMVEAEYRWMFHGRWGAAVSISSRGSAVPAISCCTCC